jgi:hypothetical protein
MRWVEAESQSPAVMRETALSVMARLGAAGHAASKEVVDARHKAGHDVIEAAAIEKSKAAAERSPLTPVAG